MRAHLALAMITFSIASRHTVVQSLRFDRFMDTRLVLAQGHDVGLNHGVNDSSVTDGKVCSETCCATVIFTLVK